MNSRLPEDLPDNGESVFPPFEIDPYQELANEFESRILDPENIVLDPSAMRYLPELVKYTELNFLVPRVLYQLLAVPYDDTKSVEDLANFVDEAGRSLLDIALDTLSFWMPQRRKLRWASVRDALSSNQCRPVWPITEQGKNLLERSLVVSSERAS